MTWERHGLLLCALSQHENVQHMHVSITGWDWLICPGLLAMTISITALDMFLCGHMHFFLLAYVVCKMKPTEPPLPLLLYSTNSHYVYLRMYIICTCRSTGDPEDPHQEHEATWWRGPGAGGSWVPRPCWVWRCLSLLRGRSTTGTCVPHTPIVSKPQYPTLRLTDCCCVSN